MVVGFSLRAILGYLNTDDINGLQGRLAVFYLESLI